MLYINVVLTVTDEKNVAEVRSLLTEHAKLSRAEPGCERFELYHSANDPKVFILSEHWTDQAAIDEHRKALGYTTIYVPKVIPLVERAPHPSELLVQ